VPKTKLVIVEENWGYGEGNSVEALLRVPVDADMDQLWNEFHESLTAVKRRYARIAEFVAWLVEVKHFKKVKFESYVI
jgi:hypothetical protein